jgi:hypothetical protein
MVPGITTTCVRSHRVIQFTLIRHADALPFPFSLRAAV